MGNFEEKKKSGATPLKVVWDYLEPAKKSEPQVQIKAD